MPGFYTGGGGATPAEVWNYPVRALTQYRRTVEIIKNRDYANATPDDIVYATVAYASGLVSLNELASFIDYGVENLDGISEVYANIIQLNPLNFWLEDVVALILDNVNVKVLSGAKILASARITADKVASIMNSPGISTDKCASILNDASFPVPRVASVLNSANISVSRVADILGSANIDPSKARNILADPSIHANKVQSILYTMVDKGYYDRLIQIMASGAPDASITANTTLTAGVNRYRSLTIASNVTLTLGAGPGVLIADTITNNGTIRSGWYKASGGAQYDYAGPGGRGAGAIIILARSMTIGTVDATGEGGGGSSSSAGNFTGNGGNGGAGLFWAISPDTVVRGGHGGGGGAYDGRGNPNAGGAGGACSSYGGSAGSVTIISFTSATALLNELLKAVVDWWIVNILGKTPSSTKSIPSLGGSGGGGGGSYSSYGCAGGGGGGGGGGGEIIVYSTGVVAGNLRARGGNGGYGYWDGNGGGGGSGGIIYLYYRSMTGTNTFDVSGGAGGGMYYRNAGVNGSPGSAGVWRGIAV